MMSPCRLCPRSCAAKRLNGEKGICGVSNLPMVSAYHLHFGEESVLVGRGGSGTIFFTGCSLKCVYCQNYEISQLMWGEVVSVNDLAEMMLELQSAGAENINLVTPSHQVPFIVEAIMIASRKGLTLPIVYNSSGYDSVETLKILEGVIDIYMPDAKYSNSEASLKYSQIPDYFEVMKKALKEMHRQVGDLIIENGIAVRGLLVRHLVLPKHLAGSEKILSFIAQEISKDTFVNIMSQYYPTYKAHQCPELSRRITKDEYMEVLKMAKKLGLKRAERY
ncbi:radical SAM protein [Thermococci archaeon]|nr:MAG: radical SAM protein [Thermococci archaeon]